MSAENEKQAMSRLRARLGELSDTKEAKPTIKDVTIIVDGLLAVEPLKETAARLKRPTLAEGENMVLDVIAAFGTWITHSMGAANVKVEWASENEQLSLVQTAERAPKPKCKKTTTNVVIGPAGYEPDARHRRNVERALASIVATRPNEEVVARFVARTYTTRSARLTYPLVAGVWGFAARNRLGDLDRVSDDAVFLQKAIEGYDLLELARADAVNAIEYLIGDEADDIEMLEQAVAKANWLAESEMRQVGKLVQATVRDPSNRRRLEQELRFLAQRVRKHSDRYKVACVGALTMGQVRKICSAAGLLPGADARATESAIRAQLKSLGLQTDADRLVPEAMRASERGQLEEFWDIIQNRLDGDASWHTQLSELGMP